MIDENLNAEADVPEKTEPEPTAAVEAPVSAAPVSAGLDIGSQAAAEGTAAEPAVVNLRGKIMPDGSAVATGRRKTAVARVRLKLKGSGKIQVNERSFEEFFPVE